MKEQNGRKFDPARRARLVSPGRRRRLPPYKTLRRLGLKRGETFVDIGCGPGFFSLPAARIVGPEGMVVSLDVSREMLADLEAEAARRGVSNVKTFLVGEAGSGIPPGKAWYFLGDVLHEVPDVERYLALLHRRLGPRSRLAVLEFHKRRTAHGPPLSHRLALSRMRSGLREAGFRVLKSFDVNDEEYALVAGK